MNITAATKTTDRSQERAEDVCWSSEWTFIKEVDGASQNPDRSVIVDGPEEANHDEIRPSM